MKNNKGITLIALVVTIIVLLILAGISIAMLTGQNGLLNRTNEAKSKNIEATIDEKVRLAVAALRLEIATSSATDPHYDARQHTVALMGDLEKDLKNYVASGWTLKANPSTDANSTTDASIQIVYNGTDYTNATNKPNAKIKYALRVNQQTLELSDQVLADEATASNVTPPAVSTNGF